MAAEDYYSPHGPVNERMMALPDGTHGKVIVTAPTSAEDQDRGWFRTVNGASQRIPVKRLPTTTAGVFANNGRVPLVASSGTGSAGDYLRKLRIRVEAGGKAGVWLHQSGDAPVVQGTTGTAIGASTSQSFGAGANQTFTANQLADRVISFYYTPAGGVAQWFTTEIASHAAISATATLALTLKHAPEAGSVPTQWMIEGLKSRQVLAPDMPAGTYEVEYSEASETGGWLVSVGASVPSLEAFVDVTG